MTRRKLERLRKELQGLLGRSGLKGSELRAFAKRCGRQEDTTRGKELTFVTDLVGTTPLTIPHHPTINKYTARNILYQLEEDLNLIEQSLPPDAPDELEVDPEEDTP